jgi:hypothetical protein
MDFAGDHRTFPSETIYLNEGVGDRMRLHTTSQKDRKAIVALADSFRKLLSLRILASGTTFSLQCPMRMPNNKEMWF